MSQAIPQPPARGDAASAPAGKAAPAGVGCQLQAFPAQLESGPPSREEPWSWYLRRRWHGALKRLRGLFRRTALASQGRPAVSQSPAPDLRAGDRVRVRPVEIIRSTLDEGSSLRGCSFALGMYQYCGQELRVARVVERFFDEARCRMLRARRMVLLEGVHCDGSNVPETQGCDRMCFYFWRSEWLERVEGS